MSGRFAILGVGMMGGAILKGVLGSGFFKPEDVTVYDIDTTKVNAFKEAYGIGMARSNRDAVTGAKTVLLAIKPQYLNPVLDEIADVLDSDAVVVSIAVGVPLGHLQEHLGTANIVRVMPNTPAQVGQGVSGYVASPAVSAQDKQFVHELLTQIGTAIELANEDQLDQLGAISGSGPAFVYLFMEAMIDAGVHLGLARTVAQELVVQTVLGSAAYIKERSAHPAVLRNEVTSPGGTTAEGLYFLEKENLRGAVARCVWGSYERTRQIKSSGTTRETGPEGN